MDRKAAKELLHIQGWFLRVDEIVQRGRRPTSTTASFKRPETL
jgi:hypothetical protein